MAIAFNMKEYLRLKQKFYNDPDMTDQELLELGRLSKVVEIKQKIDMAKEKSYPHIFRRKRFDKQRKMI